MLATDDRLMYTLLGKVRAHIHKSKWLSCFTSSWAHGSSTSSIACRGKTDRDVSVVFCLGGSVYTQVIANLRDGSAYNAANCSIKLQMECALCFRSTSGWYRGGCLQNDMTGQDYIDDVCEHRFAQGQRDCHDLVVCSSS